MSEILLLEKKCKNIGYMCNTILCRVFTHDQQHHVTSFEIIKYQMQNGNISSFEGHSGILGKKTHILECSPSTISASIAFF